MHRSIALTSLIAVLAACTPTPPAQVTGKTPLTKDFVGGELGWRGSRDDRTVIFARIRDQGGMTELCGAVYSDGSSIVKGLERDVLRTSSFAIDGILLVSSIEYFNRIASPDSEAMATCAITGVPWNPHFDSRNLEYRSSTRTYTY